MAASTSFYASNIAEATSVQRAIPNHEYSRDFTEPYKFLEVIVHEVAQKYRFTAYYANDNYQMLLFRDLERHMTIYANDVSHNRSADTRICDDKASTSTSLKGIPGVFPEIPHIEHRIFFKPANLADLTSQGWEGILAFGEGHRYNMVCKPKSESGGKGVVHTQTKEAYIIAVRELFQTNRDIVICRYEEFEDEYRIYVDKDTFPLSYRKIRPYFVGDGTRTNAALFKEFQETSFKNFNDSHRVAFQKLDSSPSSQTAASSKETPREQLTKKMLRSARKAALAASTAPFPTHLDPNKVPDAGEMVNTIWKHNLSQGATAEFIDLTIKEEDQVQLSGNECSEAPSTAASSCSNTVSIQSTMETTVAAQEDAGAASMALLAKAAAASQGSQSFEKESSGASSTAANSGSKIAQFPSAMGSQSAVSGPKISKPRPLTDSEKKAIKKMAKDAQARLRIESAAIDIARLKNGMLKVAEPNSGIMIEQVILQHSIGGDYFGGIGYKKAKECYERIICRGLGYDYIPD